MAADPRAFFEWLATTPVSAAFNGSSYWYFGAAMAVHLIGIALLGGTSLALGLRVLGWRLHGAPLDRLVRTLAPWFWGGLAVAVLAGLWLLVADPLKYYVNPAFRIKAVLLVAALVVQARILRTIRRKGAPPSPSAALKLLALTSVVLWFGATAAGRIVGLI